jgi:hypothetical protein
LYKHFQVGLGDPIAGPAAQLDSLEFSGFDPLADGRLGDPEGSSDISDG